MPLGKLFEELFGSGGSHSGQFDLNWIAGSIDAAVPYLYFITVLVIIAVVVLVLLKAGGELGRSRAEMAPSEIERADRQDRRVLSLLALGGLLFVIGPVTSIVALVCVALVGIILVPL